MSATRRSEFIAGVRDTFPMELGAVPLAIIIGTFAIDAGLSPAGAMGLSLFVFAGSAQFIGVGLLQQGAPLGVIVLTTFIVNLRHVLYSASLAPLMKRLSQTWLLPLAFWLTDETYALVIRRYQNEDVSPYKHWYHFGSSVLMYINWNFWTVVGIITGQQLQGLENLRLDFAMVVTFVGILVPLLVTRPMLLCAAVAGATAVVTYDMPNKMGLMIAAVLGIAAGMLAEAFVKQPRTIEQETA